MRAVSLVFAAGAFVLLAACGDDDSESRVTAEQLTAACIPAVKAQSGPGGRVDPKLSKHPAKVCTCLGRLLVGNKDFPADARKALLEAFQSAAKPGKAAMKAAESRLKPHLPVYRAALNMCREGLPPDKPKTKDVVSTKPTVAMCAAWVRFRATKLPAADATVAQARAEPVCKCILKQLTAAGALNEGDQEAVRTFFIVFSNPVKRDPAWGHISQDGRRALSTALTGCAKQAGFVIK